MSYTFNIWFWFMKKKIRIAAVVLLTYVLLSLYGSVWVSDSLDYYRVTFYSIFGVPVCFSLIASFFFHCDYWVTKLRLFQYLGGIILVVFAWGNFLLVNAVVSSQVKLVRVVKQTDEEKKAYTVRLNQGAFGWYYRSRW